MTEFTRPQLYPKQLAAMFHDKRYGLIEAGTKSGKTVSAIAWLTERAIMGAPGQNFWWVAPGYTQSDIAYRRIKSALTAGSFQPLASPTPHIYIPQAGTTIWFKTGDNADALYGEDVYAAVVDEASRTKEDCWYALRSTLTATRGPCRMIGNVRGRKNWFYDMCRKAQNGDLPNAHYASITASDAITAGVIDADEVEDAKRTLPEAIFRELYFNEPSDDGGNPFGLDHIRACTVDGLAVGPAVAWGLDLAKSRDYFVCIGLNEVGDVCAFERWRAPWRVSIRRAWALIGEDTPALVDSTGVGDPVLEELQVEHSNFHGYSFTPASKQRLMEGLAVSIQSHELHWPDGQIRVELEDFEYEVTRSGVRYAAVEGEGKHDDCVCALALARQCWAEGAPSANFLSFMKEREVQEKALAALPEPSRPVRIIAANEVLDNELTQLYEETLTGATPAKTARCAYCGEPVLGTRISDGDAIWHPEHAALSAARAA